MPHPKLVPSLSNKRALDTQIGYLGYLELILLGNPIKLIQFKIYLKLNKFYLNKAFIDNLQRFLRSVSGTGTGQHRGLPVLAPAPTGPDTYRPAPACTGTNRHRPDWTRTRPAPTGPGIFMTFLILILY
jgi:hypothetical protein